KRCAPILASMEPRLLSRGNAAGAYTRPVRRMLQWSHGFSAVETPRRQPGRAAWLRFNGATASQPWKPARKRLYQQALKSLQWSHGFSAVETRSRSRRRARLRRFNGATASQPWKPVGLLGVAAGRRRFNGATASQPWKRGRPSAASGIGSLLQWSHGFSAVETGPLHDPHPPTQPASMEPRLLSRGNRLVRHANGRGRGASMEPRPRSRGNRARARRQATRAAELQWSHGFSAVETT